MRWQESGVNSPWAGASPRIREAEDWLSEVADAAKRIRRLGDERERLRLRASHVAGRGCDVVTRRTAGDGAGPVAALADFESDHADELSYLKDIMGRFDAIYEDALLWPEPVPSGARAAREHYVLGDTWAAIARRHGVSPSCPRMQCKAFVEVAAQSL